jgi:hypothetical protein
MERMFKKLLGKWWMVFQGCATARQLYSQIYTDAQRYLRRVVTSECELVNLEVRRISRSKSAPCLTNLRLKLFD